MVKHLVYNPHQQTLVCRTHAWTEGCVWATKVLSTPAAVSRPGLDQTATRVNFFFNHLSCTVWGHRPTAAVFLMHRTNWTRFPSSVLSFTSVCSDMDECEKDPCPAGSRCVNTRGSFSCECPLGLDLEDGRACTRGNPAASVRSFIRFILICSLYAPQFF